MVDRLRAGAWLLATVTVLAEMAYPLVGSDARAPLTFLTVAVYFGASVLHSSASRGAAWTASLVAVTAGGGLLVEAVGVATGLPFGGYHYTPALGPTAFAVPVIIPLAWTMMAYPAYVVASGLCRSRWARVAVGAWALASWDVFLDPQMVGAGYWHWANPGLTLPGVPDVPLSNYAGWLVVAAAMMTLLVGAESVRARPVTEQPAATRRDRTGDGVPVTLYLWTYFSSILAHAAFFGLPWSALWGAVLMGFVALPRLAALGRHRRAVRPA